MKAPLNLPMGIPRWLNKNRNQPNKPTNNFISGNSSPIFIKLSANIPGAFQHDSNQKTKLKKQTNKQICED